MSVGKPCYVVMLNYQLFLFIFRILCQDMHVTNLLVQAFCYFLTTVQCIKQKVKAEANKVKTLNAPSSVTNAIPSKMAAVLAVVRMSRINFFSLRANLMLFNFCSTSGEAKTRQCPKIWLGVNLWF